MRRSISGSAAVLQLGRLGVVARLLRALHLEAHLLELLLERARLLDRVLFLVPVGRQPGFLFLEIAELLLELLEPLARRLVGFLPQGFALDLELHDPALDLVELRRHRVDLHAEARGGLVHEIDRLVGQEPIRDVAVRQQRGGHERGVLDPDAVVNLVALAQPAQDADRVLDGRLADHHRLEAALERGVLLDVLAVLVQRGRANHVQLAAREHRLQHVGGVHRPFGGAGADDGVELVDEEDDLAGRVGDFLQHRLEPFLELAAVLRARDQRAHVEADDPLRLEPFGHVLPHDALREPFDDGGLADARLADEHRVVLGAARQHLDHAADLLVAADHRIELALARQFGEVAAVALERLVGALGILARDALRPAHGGHRLQHRVLGDPALLEQPRGGGLAPFGHDRQEQVFRADVLVLQPFGFLLRGVRDGAQAGRERRLRAAVRARLPVQLLAHRRGQRRRVRIHLAHDLRHDAFALFDERQEEVLRLNLRISLALGKSLRPDDGLLGLLCVFVDIHGRSRTGAYRSIFRQRLPLLALILRQRAGELDLHRRVQIATVLGLADGGHAVSLQAEHLAALRGLRDLEAGAAGDRRHVGLAAEHRRRDRHGDLGVQVAPFPLEDRMRLETHAQVQVS